MAELLTVDGFKMDKVIELIDGSEKISATNKMLLKAGIEKAQDNPEMLKSALDAVKTAIGL